MARAAIDTDQKVIEGKIFAVMSYLSILCIIPLLFKKDNEFVLLHGKQGLVLFIGQVGVFIISIIFPWFLKLGFFLIGVMSFVGIVAVLRGLALELPVVARIADKITL